MNIYRFAKYIWCWDITIGCEPWCYVMAETEEDTIRKVNESDLPERRYSDRGLDLIDIIDKVPDEHSGLLI